jgi:hypothetical protein
MSNRRRKERKDCVYYGLVYQRVRKGVRKGRERESKEEG